MAKKNHHCDNCPHPASEVRLYSIGGGGNLILCYPCWVSENAYRVERGRETGQPENWPVLDWAKAKIYGVD